LLDYDALLHAYDDDLAGALHNVKAIIYVGRCVADNQTFDTQRIRIACDKLATRVLERSLSYGCAGDQTLFDIQKELEKEAQTPFFLAGLRALRANIDFVLEKVGKGETKYDDLARFMPGSVPHNLRNEPSLNTIISKIDDLRVYMYLSSLHAQLLHHMNKLVEFAKLPTWLMMAPLKASDQALILNIPAWFPLCSFSGVDALFDIHIKAELRTAYTALAMERFHIAKGHWPDKIDELVPQFLSEMPLDPYDGAPLSGPFHK
jgi:hypothetical protein